MRIPQLEGPVEQLRSLSQLNPSLDHIRRLLEEALNVSRQHPHDRHADRGESKVEVRRRPFNED
jgi:hypothetical protein